MKIKAGYIAAALAVTFTLSSAHANQNNFNAAEQCMLDEIGEQISRGTATKPQVDIYLDPIQEKCETTTGLKVEDQRILAKGPSNFRAGGTQFIFK